MRDLLTVLLLIPVVLPINGSLIILSMGNLHLNYIDVTPVSMRALIAEYIMHIIYVAKIHLICFRYFLKS